MKLETTPPATLPQTLTRFVQDSFECCSTLVPKKAPFWEQTRLISEQHSNNVTFKTHKALYLCCLKNKKVSKHTIYYHLRQSLKRNNTF